VVENLNPDCVLGQIKINGTSIDGFEVDSEGGNMIVSVEKAIPETNITLSYMVGSTELFSDPFTIEVFDCAQMIKLPEVPEVQIFQVGQIVRPINASFEYASNNTAQDCPIEAY
jgi:hypothetical protein